MTGIGLAAHEEGVARLRDARARLAVDVFIHSARHWIGAMLVEREVDEDAGAPLRTGFGGSAEQQDGASPHPPRRWR